MKDTNGKTITEEEFMKDIGHGVVGGGTNGNYMGRNLATEKPKLNCTCATEPKPLGSMTALSCEEHGVVGIILRLNREESEKQGWRVELSKFYGCMFESGDFDKLEDFISEQIEKERNKVLDEVKREVEKENKSLTEHTMSRPSMFEAGKLQQLQDISKIIDQLKLK